MSRSRSLPLALATCAGLAAGGGALAAADTATTARTHAQTIRGSIPFRDLGMKQIDTKPRGPSSGDRALDFAALNGRSGRREGYLMQACDLARLHKLLLTSCAGGIQLARGRLTFASAGVEAGNDSTYAITGGTGAYATARGTVVSHPARTAIFVTIRVAG